MTGTDTQSSFQVGDVIGWKRLRINPATGQPDEKTGIIHSIDEDGEAEISMSGGLTVVKTVEELALCWLVKRK